MNDPPEPPIDPPAHDGVTRLRARPVFATPPDVVPVAGISAMPAEPAEPPAAVGSILGQRYLLECVLEGNGAPHSRGAGVAYRALDLDATGEIYAVKLFQPELRYYLESSTALRATVRAVHALQHPNIMAVYSLNVDPGGIYILMEYQDGKSLATLMSEAARGMPWERAWPLLKDIGAALTYAHDNGIVHGDLRPSQVLVTAAGRVKLLNFGINRALAADSEDSDPGASFLAESAYASPETLAGWTPDESDDVYSCACIIYEMVDGRHPFARRRATDARNANLRPPPIASLTSKQNQALAQALTGSRGDRTPSVNVLLAQLERAAVPLPATPNAGQAGTATTAAPASARKTRPMLMWAGGGLAGCVLIGLVAWLALRTPPPAVAPTPPVAAAPVTMSTDQALDRKLVVAGPPASLPGAADADGPPAVGVPTVKAPPPRSAASPRLAAAPKPASPTHLARVAEANTPPMGKTIPPIAPTPDSADNVGSCPYPAEARKAMETGTVILLIHVGADGGVLGTSIDQSSGSEVLDQAAAACVAERAHFAPRANRSQGYWGRMRFNWSFG